MEKVTQSPGQRATCQLLNFYFRKTGWTKDRWSIESGVPATRIGEYLEAERNPDEPTLEKLLKPLGISFTKFYRAKEFNYIPCRNKTVQK
jgi:transcriptional regulator with XRE-family HTH domain